MNLLELMLGERIIFPAYAQYAVQDYTGRVKFADKKPVCNEKYYTWEGCWCLHYIDGNKRLESWHSDIVTREQYASAGGTMEVETDEVAPLTTKQSVDATLTERGNRYGKFKDHAELSQ